VRNIPLVSRSLLVVAAVVAVTFAAGALPATAADQPKVLAKIGNDTITEADLGELTKSLAQQGGLVDDSQKKALEYLINVYVLAAEAQAQGLDKDPEVQRFMKFNKQDLLARIYLDKMTKNLPDPTEQQAKEYYEKNKDEFTIPESVLLHHILVKTEKEAKDAQARIKKGEKFADVATQISLCPSKLRGGNLDWLPKGSLVKEIEDAAFGMEKGQMLGPVQSKFGYHVLFLEDKKPAQATSFDQAQPQIVERLKFTARQENYENTAQELRKKMNVQIVEQPQAAAPEKPLVPAGPATNPPAGPKKN